MKNHLHLSLLLFSFCLCTCAPPPAKEAAANTRYAKTEWGAENGQFPAACSSITKRIPWRSITSPNYLNTRP